MGVHTADTILRRTIRASPRIPPRPTRRRAAPHTSTTTLVPRNNRRGAAALALALLAACGDAGSGASSPTLFATEGNRLHAFALDGSSARQIVIQNATEAPIEGRDVNGQICFLPDDGGPPRFLLGDDTGQPDPPPGWGLFELSGDRVGDFTARPIGKLVTTFQPPRSAADPYGCGVLADGRLVTTDIGNNASGPPTGQLTLWFPPFDRGPTRFCKLDVAIGTAGGIYVDASDHIHVASARVTAGVLRYAPPYPTSDDAAGGCGRRDETGAPLADEIRRERWITASPDIPTPGGVAAGPDGTLYVSSMINGVIAAFDPAGTFLRRVLEPPSGESLGPEPISTGTPFGIATDDAGNVYYADLGLVIRNGSIGPAAGTGSVRALPGAKGAPTTLGAGLSFPDGVAVLP